jgi:hypothetical protein
MRVAFRHFLLDTEGTPYRLPSAALDRMLRDPVRHRLPRFAGQRVRSAEIAVELMNGQPIQVVRSWFNILTFKKNGTLVPPLSDRHVRARAELALALEQPIRDTAVADASTRFLARGGQWSPSAAVRRRIEQIALGRQKCERV